MVEWREECNVVIQWREGGGGAAGSAWYTVACFSHTGWPDRHAPWEWEALIYLRWEEKKNGKKRDNKCSVTFFWVNTH